jgi:hypothetical protein
MRVRTSIPAGACTTNPEKRSQTATSTSGMPAEIAK